MINGQFVLPFSLEILATFLLGITGAIVAIEKKYDFSGVVILAFIAGASGGILRDGLFLSRMPLFIQKWEYLAAILAASIVTIIFIYQIKRITLAFVMIDALGLGLFGIIGAQIALDASVNFLSAIFIGLVGAAGGGLLRDMVTREKPMLLIPGQYYLTAALTGIVLFVFLCVYGGVDATVSAILSIIMIFFVRMLSYLMNWQTFPAVEISKKLSLSPKEKK